jgi:hypothetical protein
VEVPYCLRTQLAAYLRSGGRRTASPAMRADLDDRCSARDAGHVGECGPQSRLRCGLFFAGPGGEH